MAAATHWSNQLQCRRVDYDGAVCLVLSGELDLASIATLQAQFKAVAQREDDVVVDMGGLRYIDSSGAKVLLDAQRLLARSRRRIVMANVQPMARRIIDVMGIEKAIPIFSTVEAALEDLQKNKEP
ncbi:MAG TPA: STAS domain-containing protein [bacterium]|nr:STAS domain-containing protein [bacterium]HKS97721.1 STAS domain-containing protein [Terriglobia bacterium]